MSKSMNSIRGAVSFLLLVVFVSIGGSPVANAAPYNSGTNTGDVSCTGGGYFTVTTGVVTGNTSCAGIAAIPDGVTVIGDSAFLSNTLLTRVTFGSGSQLTVIDYQAFKNASSLTSITIPNSVTTIVQRAFAGATALTSLTIGNSVTSIGDDAFRDLTSLTSLIIPQSVLTIGLGAFFTTPLLAEYTYCGTALTAGTGLEGKTRISLCIVPAAPTIDTVTATGTTTATVAFTAPGHPLGPPILSYTATSSPGGITATITQAGSGTISVTGLSPATAYTFTVIATNAIGSSVASSTSSSITTFAPTPVFVPPMLPSFAPSITVNNGTITCTIGEYSRAATSVAFSLFVDGNHVATNFSSTGDHLPSWLAPWASASTIQRSATLQSASWNIDIASDASRASCWTLAYSNNATGLISSEQISLR
jgi:hypothetical protein